MNGVDKADQLIACHWLNLQCPPVWMPVWFHCLDAVCVNSCIACTQMEWRPARSNTRSQHKEYTMEFIKAVIAKGKMFEIRATRQRILASWPIRLHQTSGAEQAPKIQLCLTADCLETQEIT